MRRAPAAALLALLATVAGCTGSTVGAVPPTVPRPSASPPSTVSPPPVLVPSLDPAEAPLPGAASAAGAAPLTVAQVGLPAATGAVVLDAGSDATLLDVAADTPVLPASTVKLLTATAALRVLGPDRRLRTRVLGQGSLKAGVLTGDLVLVGGGDPTLSAATMPVVPGAASLPTLVTALRAVGVHRVTGRVRADATLFTGPATGPQWSAAYVSGGSVAPVSALSLDGGKLNPAGRTSARVADPALAAAAELTRQLRRAGVAVAWPAARGAAATGATELAGVDGAPMATLVTRMLRESDNDLAEALGRLVALAGRQRATFAGAAAAVLRAQTLPTAGVRLLDASGLSRGDLVPPRLLAELVRASLVAGEPAVRPLADALPLAGRTGTLTLRFRRGVAAAGNGRVHAKTGRLLGVASLAGWTRTRGGRVLVFALVTRGAASSARAEADLDAVAGRLAALP